MTEADKSRTVQRLGAPRPFYRVPCEYVPMAHQAEGQEAEITKLQADLKSMVHNAYDWADVACQLWQLIKLLKGNPTFIDQALSNGEEIYNEQTAKWRSVETELLAIALQQQQKEPKIDMAEMGKARWD